MPIGRDLGTEQLHPYTGTSSGDLTASEQQSIALPNAIGLASADYRIVPHATAGEQVAAEAEGIVIEDGESPEPIIQPTRSEGNDRASEVPRLSTERRSTLRELSRKQAVDYLYSLLSRRDEQQGIKRPNITYVRYELPDTPDQRAEAFELHNIIGATYANSEFLRDRVTDLTVDQIRERSTSRDIEDFNNTVAETDPDGLHEKAKLYASSLGLTSVSGLVFINTQKDAPPGTPKMQLDIHARMRRRQLSSFNDMLARRGYNNPSGHKRIRERMGMSDETSDEALAYASLDHGHFAAQDDLCYVTYSPDKNHMLSVVIHEVVGHSTEVREYAYHIYGDTFVMLPGHSNGGPPAYISEARAEVLTGNYMAIINSQRSKNEPFLADSLLSTPPELRPMLMKYADTHDYVYAAQSWELLIHKDPELLNLLISCNLQQIEARVNAMSPGLYSQLAGTNPSQSGNLASMRSESRQTYHRILREVYGIYSDTDYTPEPETNYSEPKLRLQAPVRFRDFRTVLDEKDFNVLSKTATLLAKASSAVREMFAHTDLKKLIDAKAEMDRLDGIQY